MSTKNNPGEFDCYAKAEPDEPMFVLLGRDEYAPALVLSWAFERERNHQDPEKVAEARACAMAMVDFRKQRLDVVATGTELECLVAGVISTFPPFDHGHPLNVLPMAKDIVAAIDKWETEPNDVPEGDPK